MKKYTILYVAVFLFSFSNAQYFENYIPVAWEVYNAEDIVTTIPLQPLPVYSLPEEGNSSEKLSGNFLYAAGPKNKKLHGNWQSWYENGILCDSGAFVKGLPDGEWKHWDMCGRLLALRTYSAEKFQRINNEFVRYNPRRISFALTALYHKNKRAALKYLRASYSFSNADLKKMGFPPPQLMAANIEPVNTYQPVFDYSLHHGLYINFFDNGAAKDSGYYKNGLRQGEWTHRDTNGGTMRQGSYNNGIKVKGWRAYNESGKLLAMIFYNPKGEVSWRKSFQ